MKKNKQLNKFLLGASILGATFGLTNSAYGVVTHTLTGNARASTVANGVNPAVVDNDIIKQDATGGRTFDVDKALSHIKFDMTDRVAGNVFGRVDVGTNAAGSLTIDAADILMPTVAIANYHGLVFRVDGHYAGSLILSGDLTDKLASIDLSADNTAATTVTLKSGVKIGSSDAVAPVVIAKSGNINAGSVIVAEGSFDLTNVTLNVNAANVLRMDGASSNGSITTGADIDTPITFNGASQSLTIKTTGAAPDVNKVITMKNDGTSVLNIAGKGVNFTADTLKVAAKNTINVALDDAADEVDLATAGNIGTAGTAADNSDRLAALNITKGKVLVDSRTGVNGQHIKEIVFKNTTDSDAKVSYAHNSETKVAIKTENDGKGIVILEGKLTLAEGSIVGEATKQLEELQFAANESLVLGKGVTDLNVKKITANNNAAIEIREATGGAHTITGSIGDNGATLGGIEVGSKHALSLKGTKNYVQGIVLVNNGTDHASLDLGGEEFYGSIIGSNNNGALVPTGAGRVTIEGSDNTKNYKFAGSLGYLNNGLYNAANVATLLQVVINHDKDVELTLGANDSYSVKEIQFEKGVDLILSSLTGKADATTNLKATKFTTSAAGIKGGVIVDADLDFTINAPTVDTINKNLAGLSRLGTNNKTITLVDGINLPNLDFVAAVDADTNGNTGSKLSVVGEYKAGKIGTQDKQYANVTFDGTKANTINNIFTKSVTVDGTKLQTFGASAVVGAPTVAGKASFAGTVEDVDGAGEVTFTGGDETIKLASTAAGLAKVTFTNSTRSVSGTIAGNVVSSDTATFISSNDAAGINSTAQGTHKNVAIDTTGGKFAFAGNNKFVGTANILVSVANPLTLNGTIIHDDLTKIKLVISDPENIAANYSPVNGTSGEILALMNKVGTKIESQNIFVDVKVTPGAAGAVPSITKADVSYDQWSSRIADRFTNTNKDLVKSSVSGVVGSTGDAAKFADIVKNAAKTDIADGDDTGASVVKALKTVDITQVAQVPNQVHKVINNRMNMISMPAAISSGDEDSSVSTGVYIEGFGYKGSNSSDAAKSDHKGLGLTLGIDALLNDGDTLFGAAFTYASNKIEPKEGGSIAKIDGNTKSGSVYAKHVTEANVFVEGVMTYSAFEGKYDGKRIDSTGNAKTDVKGNFDMNLFSFSGSVGYNWKLDTVTVAPYVGGEYVGGTSKGFTEKDSNFNLAVESRDVSIPAVHGGVKLSTQIANDNSIITPFADLRLKYSLAKDDEHVVKAKLNGAIGSMALKYEIGKLSFNPTVGVVAKMDQFEIQAAYNGSMSKKEITHGGSVRVKVHF